MALAATAALSASLALVAGPAAAADSDVDSAQARYDRLATQSHQAEQRHDRVAASLKRNRAEITSLTRRMQREQATMVALQRSVAGLVGDAELSDAAGSTGAVSYTPGLGAAQPSTGTDDAAADRLLTNVAVISEDTHGLAAAMADAAQRLEVLQARRTTLVTHVQSVSDREDRLSRSADRLSDRTAAADEALKKARAAAYEKRVGPAVAYAMSKVGDAYVYGAAGPSAFDCSGLTMMAWQQAGVSLPHSSSAQYSSGPHISESELQPGDLVFYYSPISHVGMYIGNGKIVNAENPGAGVRVTDLHAMPYVGAVRPG